MLKRYLTLALIAIGLLIVTVIAQEIITNKINISNLLTEQERNTLIQKGYSSSLWTLENCYDNNMILLTLNNSRGEIEEFGLSMLGESCSNIKTIENKIAEYLKSKTITQTIPPKEPTKITGIIEVSK